MTKAMVRYVATSAPEPNPTLPLPLNPTPPFSLEQRLQRRVYFPGDPDVSRCRGEAQEAGPGRDYCCQWGSRSSWNRGIFLCGGELRQPARLKYIESPMVLSTEDNGS